MKRLWIMVTLMMAMVVPLEGQAARLKDVADVEGVRDNQLIGFGLIAGLNGTGDSANRSAFTTQSLVMMLERMGISARDSLKQIGVKNLASAMVTANLPPFARQGTRLDVTLSSLGDAKSLEGGTLIMTPMKGADGRIYAVAQGPVSIGGIAPSGGGNTAGAQKNHPTVGRISGGAIVEREIEFELNQEQTLQLTLRNPDFTTANRTVGAINSLLGQPLAKARDSGTITLKVPKEYQDRVVEYIARLENLEIESDQSAKIVINERTGTVVMGENVRISTIALSHGNLNIRIRQPEETPKPATQRAAAGQQAQRPVQEEIARLMEMDEGVTLADLVNGLNKVGATPKDLIAILQAIKSAGALQAEIEIL
ncbi:MAG: flagellar basal body P-ring protein FlgI [Magnetococcales bacterium]|nr:flagellar basal body P-ring protein FlgI [Magnetococcales bacterium]NGZ25284.1 flagellar basal body P-ring protein FlgI [Magnetococcales bacterium]